MHRPVLAGVTNFVCDIGDVPTAAISAMLESVRSVARTIYADINKQSNDRESRFAHAGERHCPFVTTVTENPP